MPHGQSVFYNLTMSLTTHFSSAASYLQSKNINSSIRSVYKIIRIEPNREEWVTHPLKYSYWAIQRNPRLHKAILNSPISCVVPTTAQQLGWLISTQSLKILKVQAEEYKNKNRRVGNSELTPIGLHLEGGTLLILNHGKQILQSQ